MTIGSDDHYHGEKRTHDLRKTEGTSLQSIVYENLNIIWDYMRLDMPLAPGDCILGFGCYNDDIALRCAQLYRDGYAPRLLFTGGLGRNTLGLWTQPEAERFAAIAIQAGVPERDIIVENQASNSAENILFSRAKLEAEGLADKRLICVHKPFMERRLYAAMQVYWPQANALYTSPQLSMEEYIRRSVAQGLSEKNVIEVIVGDFQRMDVYARRGYQIPQEIPAAAWDAFHRLTALGYTGELVEADLK